MPFAFDTRAAAYCVIIRDDHVLLTQLTADYGSVWTLPGGGLELGESAEDAAVRELFEETGYEVGLGEILRVATTVIPGAERLRPEDRAYDLQAIGVYFQATVLAGELRPETGGTSLDAAWVPIVDLATLPLGRQVLAAVELAVSRTG